MKAKCIAEICMGKQERERERERTVSWDYDLLLLIGRTTPAKIKNKAQRVGEANMW